MTGQESTESPDAVEQDQDLDPDQDQDQDQDHDHDHDDGNEHPAKRQKRSRACQACRSMKIRCLPVEGQEACKACAKVNRACIMPGPARKRQKTVHKVAELEKKINALTASLAAKSQAATAPTPPTDSPATTTSTGKVQSMQTRIDKEYPWERVVEVHYPDPAEATDRRLRPPEYETMTAEEDYEDVIDRGILDEATATKLYDHWNIGMRPFSPIVGFPDKVDVSWFRRKRPMTLLSICVAAGGIIVPDLQEDLAVELARQIADRAMFLNEKSLDLIHAMLIYSSWYGKHKFAKDLGFNNYIHLSVAMSLDLGLGKRSRQQKYTDPEDAELRRTWMACYFMAGSVSTVLRLPPLVKFSPYLEECLESFKNHPGCLQGDEHLCSLVKLTHLTQDVNILFHMDDPGSNIPLEDERTQYQLKLFERQLEEYMTEVRQLVPHSRSKMTEAVLALYIHEIALHNEHNVDDFRPMYRSSSPGVTKDFLTNAHFESLTICVDAMQRALEAFLSLSTDMIRNSPSLVVVWVAYVCVAMIRLHGALAIPDSKYGSIFLPKLNVVGYLDAVINKLNTACNGPFRINAETFIIAFKKLKAWHIHRTIVQQRRAGNLSQSPMSTEAYVKAYNAVTNSLSQPCPFNSQSLEESPRRISTVSTTSQQQQKPQSNGSPSLLQQPQQQIQQQMALPQFQQAYSQPNQTFPQQQQSLTPGTSSVLLDPNAPIDASTFDIQNWDFNVGELNNFETYLNDAGWMGYLM